MPRIRAALDAGVTPSAVILRDPSLKEHTALDLKLITGYHIAEGMLRGNIPIYWDESDRVAFDVKVGTSKSRAAIERKQELDSKSKNKAFGRYYYAVPREIYGEPLPTLEEWAEEKAAKMGDERPPVG
jgi:hypothetical protein